jgi:hypothetical protein
MLLVSVSLKPSAIHGLGCFTDEAIQHGQLVWVFDARLDVRLLAAELPALPPPAQAFLAMYGYAETVAGQAVIVLCGDQARHMNHSATPNLLETPERASSAARDIAAGEELTCNYYDFDLSADQKLGPGTIAN